MHGRLRQHGEQLVARAGHVARYIQILCVEPLPPGVGPGGLLQQRQFGQFACFQAVATFKKGGAADRHGVFTHQPMRLGAGPVGIAKVDRGIEVGVGKQERAGAVGQVDRDVGVLVLEVLQARQQPLSSEGRHHGELDGVGTLLAHDRQCVTLDRVQLLGHTTTIGQPRFRELYAPARTPEQLNAEKLLQSADLPTHSALREGQLIGGLGEALVAGGCLETDQCSGAGYLASHVLSSH